MGIYDQLKKEWKKLGIKGQVINYSSKKLWVVETESGVPIARKLPPGYQSPTSVDADGFKRVDGLAIDGHLNWWKFYDFSRVEIFNQGKSIAISVVSKTAVPEKYFGKVVYQNEIFGTSIIAIIDVRRDKKKSINEYCINYIGWVPFDVAFKMVCSHEIANARPVFPKGGKPFIRTKRDKLIINNLSRKGQ